jgi:glyoxylase-like metal-dependent hydrolase (beta-lactamase superfamily II)
VRDRAERSSTRTRATNNGGLSGSDPQFTEDPAAADQSVRRLAAPAPRTIVVGHGPPMLEDAAAALEQGLARLGHLGSRDEVRPSCGLWGVD